MLKATINIFSILCLLSTFACVDDRFESVSSLNEAPTVVFTKNQSSELVDSIKVSIKNSQDSYPIVLSYSDEFGSPVKSITFDTNGGKVFNGNVELINSVDMSTISARQGVVSLTFYPDGNNIQKNYAIVFTVTDFQNASVVGTLDLVAFNNLKPYVDLTLTKIGSVSPFEYEFDASRSKDMDNKFGGEIQSFRYRINGENDFFTTERIVRHVFPAAGGYEVEVTAFDNDGESSTPLKKIVTVQ